MFPHPTRFFTFALAMVLGAISLQADAAPVPSRLLGARKTVSRGVPVVSKTLHLAPKPPVTVAKRGFFGSIPKLTASTSCTITKGSLSKNCPALQIGKNRRTITELSAEEQGTQAFVFKVGGGGWPLGGTGQNVPAVAKSQKAGTDITNERANLQAVGQLVDSGTDTSGNVWLIIKDLSATPTKFQIEQVLAEADPSTCFAYVDKMISLTNAAVQQLSTAGKILHKDNHPQNVFFDGNLRKAELIDWGFPDATKKFTPAELQQTLRQTKVLFDGDEATITTCGERPKTKA